MLGARQKIAVYTTIYPGVESYLLDWYRSVQAQTDGDFQIWIGLDGITAETVERRIGKSLGATWVPSAPGDSPAQIRQRALAQMVRTFDAVILIDSDDILHPSRVMAAREVLGTAELAACALRLVDQQGQDMGLTFGLPPGTMAEDVLPRHNVFGFSNTVYRSELLRRCLPVPAGAALVDWYLATKAWLLGARLEFDPVVRMYYRQHGANMARVRFPVSPQQVAEDTGLVRRHFQFILASDCGPCLPDRLARVKNVATEVEAFQERIVQKPGELARYVEALNALNPLPLWWASVAHPAMGSMW